MRRHSFAVASGLSLIVTVVSSAGPRDDLRRIPSPPGPPLTGPGSTEYEHKRVAQVLVDRGATGFYVIEPIEPKPQSAPVVIFVHGYTITNPRNYAAWLTHLARRGNIVIYPVYQSGYSASNEDFAENALQGVIDAYALLQDPRHVKPDGAGLFVIGHSLGASIAAYIAAEAEDRGLPPARALMLANPGDEHVPGILDRVAFDQIPADALLLAVVGDQDRLVTNDTAFRIIESTSHIPVDNRVVLELFSDDHGMPSLEANHAAAGAWHARPRTFDVRDSTTRIDALDFYGYWKWFDALIDMVISGANRDYAYGGAPAQTFMGVWSDGTPVIPAEVLWP